MEKGQLRDRKVNSLSQRRKTVSSSNRKRVSKPQDRKPTSNVSNFAYIKFFAICFIVLFLLLQVYSPAKTFWNKFQESKSVKEQLAKKKQENIDLERKIKYYKTSKGVKELAKKQLQMVNDNEQLYTPIIIEKKDNK